MSERAMLCPRCWGGGHEPEKPLNWLPGVSRPWKASKDPCKKCLGAGHAQDVQITEHFWLSHVVRSQTATRLLIPNDPTTVQVTNIGETLQFLAEPIYRERPFHISSGIRTLYLNREIRSKDTSAHVQGWALDMEPLDGKKKGFMEWIINNSGLKYDQLIYEGTWIHIGLWNPVNHAQRSQQEMAFGGKYALYDPHDLRVV